MSNRRVMLDRSQVKSAHDRIERRESTIQSEAHRYGIHPHTMGKYVRQWRSCGPERFPL